MPGSEHMLYMLAKALREAAGAVSTESVEVQDIKALDEALPKMSQETLDPALYTVVCATAWDTYKRFVCAHVNHSFLAHPHPFSRPDLDPPRGYHFVEGNWKRAW